MALVWLSQLLAAASWLPAVLLYGGFLAAIVWGWIWMACDVYRERHPGRPSPFAQARTQLRASPFWRWLERRYLI
jgi:hypothetical protein